MLGLILSLISSAAPLSLVSRIINTHRETEEEDNAIVENPNGLVAPLKFLTENPIGG